MFNLKVVNAAFTAKDGGQSFMLTGEGSKYAGFSSASSSVSYEIFLKKINSGIGVQFDTDNAVDARNLNLFYRYGIKLSEKSRLSIGTDLKVSFMDLHLTDSNGNIVRSSAKPDIDLGIAYQYKIFYVGFSVNHINQPTFTSVYSYGDVFPISYSRLFNMTIGNKFIVTKWMTLEPMLLIRGTSGNGSFNEKILNTQVVFVKKIIIGGGYSNKKYNFSNSSATKSYYGNIGLVLFKRLELISLLYSGPRYNNLFNYEFVVRIKV